MSLYNQPVVIDNGSGNLKAGFAGEEKPKSYASAIVGRPKYQKIMVGSMDSSTTGTTTGTVLTSSSSTFVGNSAQNNRGLLRLTYPIEHGIVTNWEDMELLWQSTYTQDLKTNSEDHPLLITEAPLNPRANRDKMCQLLFEQFNVPCLYISIQAVLSLYASGRTTGVVVDSGDGVSHIVPVYEGFALPNSIKRMDIAGRDITETFAQQLRKLSGLALTSLSEFEIARMIKERCCYIAKDVARDELLYGSSAAAAAAAASAAAATTSSSSSSANLSTDQYRLPDGRVIHVGPERFRAPEILFNPELIGDESPGIHELTALAIAKTDLDLRPILYKHIILSGGNTLIRGFGDRMLNELKQLQEINTSTSIWGGRTMAAASSSTSYKMKVKIYAPPERKYSTWIGGSILAGLSTFKKMWVTLLEYQENPDIIHKRYM